MPKVSNKLMLGVGAVAVILFGVSYYLSSMGEKRADTMSEEAKETSSASQSSDKQYIDFDVEAAMKDRIIGNPSAPIKIAEFASLNCSHCADFHRNVMGDFKKAYTDTGRAYVVYSDFPLNAVALQASMVARCLPEDRYFDFIDDLFATQAEWAFSPRYLKELEKKAAGYGMSSELFEACVNNEQLRESIVGGVKAASEVWNVSSTPSFVVNNQVKIMGARDLAGFEQNLNQALEELGLANDSSENEGSNAEGAPDAEAEADDSKHDH
ncbi:MAG: DsbA family protein [Micavibrio sp.]|nr:DsbA family protein [Micavibrio sp.]